MAEPDERVRDMRADVHSWPTGRLLSVAARLVEGRFDAVLAELDLTHAGMITLHHVVREPLAQRELAVLCRVTDQTMSRTTERLERSGFIRRYSDDRDRRRTLVAITPAGRKVLKTARREERESDVLLGAVDDYDRFREQLIALIAVVTDQGGFAE
ncbi:MarR family winged helix-turn-helix transcriptional regulator [Umezawaea endophytica]|uniref:MarR family transcriptional regulator n=1 Tax=Umezawaea endophytica TaxID=1654476 RepID=A0A9X3AFM5_9PSEU|nr:MarR family transcriptional regulator [Umezawaea endophytica]MCS7477375.1 MarR family transcriptional regulator [Umezawaea endophytica]